MAAYKVAAAGCQDKISTQRTIAFVLIGMGIGARIAVPMVARALGLVIADAPVERAPTNWTVVGWAVGLTVIVVTLIVSMMVAL